MGGCATVVLFALALLPLVGTPLIGWVVPLLLASFYVAIDAVARQKTKLPPALRIPALKQSPREFLNIAREEQRLLQAVLLGLFSLATVVLADVVVWLVAGTAWTNRTLGASASGLAMMILAGSILCVVYFALAAALVYALPLALLQHQPLVPAMRHSLSRSARYAVALLVVTALLAAPPVLGVLVAFYFAPLGYFVGLAAAALVLPVVACSFYCSYRTIFPALVTAPVVASRVRGMRQAG